MRSHPVFTAPILILEYNQIQLVGETHWLEPVGIVPSPASQSIDVTAKGGKDHSKHRQRVAGEHLTWIFIWVSIKEVFCFACDSK
ncbi:hypothetical protein CDAR_541951 [Caerostris darwini]|uniref:Uncharacterized protein n=1 Tax=Caerostris darwini TaxID=1538125 RepID=A0AAV4UUB6_9ARAC|nr:hypothetical protein CDAR_541951 [Caerostris darwini]